MTSVTTEPLPDEKAAFSLLKRLGGRTGLDALIGAFYFNMLRDGRVADVFSQVDIEAVMSRQRDILMLSFANDDACANRQLRAAHRRLVQEQGLEEPHFDALIDILARTLDDLGHTGQLGRSIIGRFAALRDGGRDRE